MSSPWPLRRSIALALADLALGISGARRPPCLAYQAPSLRCSSAQVLDRSRAWPVYHFYCPALSPSPLVTLLHFACLSVCVSAWLLPTGRAISRSSAAWALQHTPIDPRQSAPQALGFFPALSLSGGRPIQRSACRLYACHLIPEFVCVIVCWFTFFIVV